ncbi:MAG: hypothetical protein JO247_13020, partial [Chloroflexi bacterium]|nr:hypothetical protein [Chloroflexota bacterium]
AEPLPAAVVAVGGAGNGTDPQRLPSVTYGADSPTKFRLNGETIDLIPGAAGHTDGDTMVRFENADVIMVGDFYRSYGYPFVDPTHGGTIKGLLPELDLLMKIAGPNTKLVPGHGATIITKADLPAHRDMIVKVQASVQQLIAQGKSLQDVLAAHVTAPFDAGVPGGQAPAPPGPGTSADRFVTSIYTELKGGS